MIMEKQQIWLARKIKVLFCDHNHLGFFGPNLSWYFNNVPDLITLNFVIWFVFFFQIF